MIVYGCDVGLTGAVACLIDGRLHDVRDMPVRAEGKGTVKKRVDGGALAAVIREWRQQLGAAIAEAAFIEKVAARPSIPGRNGNPGQRGQGSASTFSLGHSFGAAESAFLALGIGVREPTPAVWKKWYGISSNKAESRGRASLLFPDRSDLWARVKDDGRAEAVLIAYYGWRELMR